MPEHSELFSCSSGRHNRARGLMAIFFFGQFFFFSFFVCSRLFLFYLFLGGKPKKVKVSNLCDVDRAVRNCYHFPRCELQQWAPLC